MNKFILLLIFSTYVACQDQASLPTDNIVEVTNDMTPNTKFLGLKSSAHCRTEYSRGGRFTGCAECYSGYYKTKQTDFSTYFYCKSCVYGCASCKSSSYCDACGDTYYRSGQNSCTACSTITTNCNSCTANSVSLSQSVAQQPTSPKCTGCRGGFYLNGQICKACIANCNVCHDDTTCVTCDFWYEYDSVNKFCKELPFWKRMLIWIAIFFGVLVFGAIFCCCCICGTVSNAANGGPPVSRWNRWRGNSQYINNGVGDEYMVSAEYSNGY